MKSSVPIIGLKRRRLDALMLARYGQPTRPDPGHVTLLARELGLARSSVQRIVNGESAPGERFIAAVLDTFRDVEFGYLFEIV